MEKIRVDTEGDYNTFELTGTVQESCSNGLFNFEGSCELEEIAVNSIEALGIKSDFINDLVTSAVKKKKKKIEKKFGLCMGDWTKEDFKKRQRIERRWL